MSPRLPLFFEKGDRVVCRETRRAGVVEDWVAARAANQRITKSRKYAVRMDCGRLEHFLRTGLNEERPL